MQILSGLKNIGQAFGVSSRVVRQWMEQGAPVLMVTPSVPCACLEELWEWLKERNGTFPSCRKKGGAATTHKAEPEPMELEGQPPPKAKAKPSRQPKAAEPRIGLENLDCPFCGTTDTLRRRGTGYRCEWCRQLFTAAELAAEAAADEHK